REAAKGVDDAVDRAEAEEVEDVRDRGDQLVRDAGLVRREYLRSFLEVELDERLRRNLAGRQRQRDDAAGGRAGEEVHLRQDALDLDEKPRGDDAADAAAVGAENEEFAVRHDFTTSGSASL